MKSNVCGKVVGLKKENTKMIALSIEAVVGN
jgi:hypothetical protein